VLDTGHVIPDLIRNRHDEFGLFTRSSILTKLVNVFNTLILVKIAVTIGVVITLSLVAERVSTSVAGVLSGYPLGAAIVLFFYGVEASPEFAAKSAVYTMPGLISTQSFVYLLLLRVIVTTWKNRKSQ